MATIRLTIQAVLALLLAFLVTLTWRLINQPTLIPPSGPRLLVAAANVNLALQRRGFHLASIYFPNGSSEVPTEGRNLLEVLTAALRQCEQPQIRVVGGASSAPFSARSGKDNVQLARARASAVKDYLDRELTDVTLIDDTPLDLTSLVRRQVFQDDFSPQLRRSTEALNRKTEVYLIDARCVRSDTSAEAA